MPTTAEEISTALQPLMGLKLSIARRALDMRIFNFGPIRKVDRGTVGDYALHIQCSWRVEGPHRIVTGRSDLWEPAESVPDVDWDVWDYNKNQNLQDRLMGEWLGSYDPQNRSVVNEHSSIGVEGLQGDTYGGAVITLSGGYRIVIFPAGTRGEDWRFFRPGIEEAHFVVSGGRIVSDS